MHPDDVADYVADAVAELERRVAQADLPIDDVELRDRTELRLRLRLRSHQAVTVLTEPPPPSPIAIPLAPGAPALPASGGVLFGPGGLVVQQQQMNVPDLGSLRTRELILRVECSDFDGQPPLAELLAPDGTPLPGPEWPHDPRL